MPKARLFLIFVVLGLPHFSFADGLATHFPGAIELPLVSKFPLTVWQACPARTAMHAISFSHKFGENLTFQESFSLQCLPSQSIVTTQCSWGQWVSNFSLSARADAASDSVIAGIAFTHRKDENFTYQERFAIMTCKLSNPHPNRQPSIFIGATKFSLQSNATCDRDGTPAPEGLIVAITIGFSHFKDENETYQEQYFVMCSTD